MNLNHLTLIELLNYLDRYNDDPNIRRLTAGLLDQRDDLILDLVDAGMDAKTRTFHASYDEYSPGEYIIHLENELSYYVDETHVLEDTIIELKKEKAQLETRTVVDFVQSIHEDLRKKEYHINELQRQLNRAQEGEYRTNQKMKVWDALTKDVPSDSKGV